MQLSVLALLVRLGVHYLVATALAVEIAVLQNYYWHVRWTWKGRDGQSVALPPGQRTDLGDLEPDLDAHLHRLAGHAGGSRESDGDRAYVHREFLARRPLGVPAEFTSAAHQCTQRRLHRVAQGIAWARW